METLARVATILGFPLAVLGLFGAIYTFRRQMNALLFLEYTKRYEEIINSFPPSARGARFDLSGEAPPESPELNAAVLRYLNLCSEEFYLWKRRYLATDIWYIWESELRRTLRSALIKREWRAVRREFASYPEFAQYVEACQAGTG